MRTRTPEPQERPLTLDELEQEHIRDVMTATRGNKRLTAQLLGIGRRTLYRKLARMSWPQNETCADATGARAR